jgi:FixJ family two-component response regulator
MPGIDGLQLQKILCQCNIPLPIIFLTGHGGFSMSVTALKSGAVYFLTKPVARQNLISTLNAVIYKSQCIFSGTKSTHEALQRISKLTSRERDVMEIAVLGATNKAIAKNLSISHRTVEVHKSNIISKTNVKNSL